MLGSDFFYRLVTTQRKLEYEKVCIAYSEPRFRWAGEGKCEGSIEDCEHGWKDTWWAYGAKLILHPDTPKLADAVVTDDLTAKPALERSLVRATGGR